MIHIILGIYNEVLNKEENLILVQKNKHLVSEIMYSLAHVCDILTPKRVEIITDDQLAPESMIINLSI